MNKVRIVAVILIGGCLAFANGCRENLDDELRKAVRSGDCPGYVTYSLEFGREEWSCFGWADVEASRQMDTHTVFRICSMTKSFVGALAAILSDRGAIDLDAHISRTFPEFIGEKKDITLRQCLSMTAGFPEMSPTMLSNGINSQNPEDVAHEMANVPLDAPPGTRFKYSNAGFEIAAAAIERQTGKELATLMNDLLIHPLGISDTTFHPTHEMMTRLAVLYKMRSFGRCTRMEDKLILPPRSGTKNGISASGGLFSTPNDVMKFYQMLLNGGLTEDGKCVMSEGAMRLITTKQTPECVPEWYSFGFFKGKEWFGHGGAYGTLAECDLVNSRLRMIFTQIRGKMSRPFLRLWRKATNESFGEEAWGGSCQFGE